MSPSSSHCATHGGARPGAGRKPHIVKYEHPLQSATERCAHRLPQTLDELEQLAQGIPVTQERWVAAGTLTLGRGKDARPAFPDLPPDQLVLVSRTTTSAKPDARAVLYLADRVLGRLTTSDHTYLEEQVEAELQHFIHKIRARFAPEVADALFRAISLPDDCPPSPLNQGDLHTLAHEGAQHPEDEASLEEAASTEANLPQADKRHLNTTCHVAASHSSLPAFSTSASISSVEKPPQIQEFKIDSTEQRCSSGQDRAPCNSRTNGRTRRHLPR